MLGLFGRARPTLGERMSATQNRPSGFDYMRLVLALGVIVWHADLICYGQDSSYHPYPSFLSPIAMLIVPMFFSLSGYLVAGSFERSKTLVTFLGLRVFRIMPALSVEVVLSALILGPIFTTLTLGEYFSHPLFFKYFLNIIGEIQYHLPGVFETHPHTEVNGQLWTVPYELICYVALSAIAVFGIYRKANRLWWALGVCYLLQILNTIYRAKDTVGGATGSTVVMSFIAGLLLYRYRDRIKWSLPLCVACLAVSLALLSIPNGMRFAPLPIAYVTVYLGLLNPPRNRIMLSGDYSYGIYLYGFAIQQAAVATSPIFRVWYMNLLVAIPAAVLVAACSWWLIEKPVMNRRDVLKRLENWYLEHSFVRHSKILQFLTVLRPLSPVGA